MADGERFDTLTYMLGLALPVAELAVLIARGVHGGDGLRFHCLQS